MNAKKPWIVPLHSSGESDASSEMNLCSEIRAAIRILLGHGSDLDLYVLPVVSNIHQAPLWSRVLPVGSTEELRPTRSASQFNEALRTAKEQIQ